MGPEHFENSEINRSIDSNEKNMKDVEAERPSFTELPQLDCFKYEMNEGGDWKTEDSEREPMELPQLEEAETVKEVRADADVGRRVLSDVPAPKDEVGEKKDAEKQYYSTYEERLKQTPGEDSGRGEWTGERGESEFIPNTGEVQDILGQYDKESITYQDAIPDFSEVAESTVGIAHMTEYRADNFKQCDEKCAEQWNQEKKEDRTDWTARDVKEWRCENGYSWHERNDMKTCDLVPTKVNDYFGHVGGVSECKKRDAEIGGNEFDE